MIRRLPDGRWRLYSQDGSRNLGTFDTKMGAEKHEDQVKMFKHMGHREVDAHKNKR